MTSVELTKEEIEEADAVAEARQNENVARGRRDAYGASAGLALHIDGARGERAVAKMLGVPWTGNLGDLGAADVGNVQVRTTKRRTGSLILHPEDKDDDLFYLVIDATPYYGIMGPIRAGDGKKDRFWRDPAGVRRHAYFVTQHYISEMSKSFKCSVSFVEGGVTRSDTVRADNCDIEELRRMLNHAETVGGTLIGEIRLYK